MTRAYAVPVHVFHEFGGLESIRNYAEDPSFRAQFEPVLRSEELWGVSSRCGLGVEVPRTTKAKAGAGFRRQILKYLNFERPASVVDDGDTIESTKDLLALAHTRIVALDAKRAR